MIHAYAVRVAEYPAVTRRTAAWLTSGTEQPLRAR